MQREKLRIKGGYIIATKRLTKAEHWEDFKPGKLIAFTEGKVMYSNERDIDI